MRPEITTFAWVPPFAHGLVRDLRPRWALEEAGIAYDVRTLAPGEAEGEAYRRVQPFGQVPAYRDAEVELFESGAILLHIVRRTPGLAPAGAQEAAATEAWLFAALSTIEPHAMNLVTPELFYPGEPWVEGFRPVAERLLSGRLDGLSRGLRGKDWLTGRFGVADIMMATVLRIVEREAAFAARADLRAYLARCVERPAFARALAAQVETFRANEPAPA